MRSVAPARLAYLSMSYACRYVFDYAMLLRVPAGHSVAVHCQGADLAFWDRASTFSVDRAAALTLQNCRMLSPKVFGGWPSPLGGPAPALLRSLSYLGVDVHVARDTTLNFFGGSFVTECTVRSQLCLTRGLETATWY